MEVFSVIDIVNTVKDAIDRFQAPSVLAGHTRHILHRDAGLSSHLQAVLPSDEWQNIERGDTPHQVKIRAKSALMESLKQGGNNREGRFRRAYFYAMLVLRRNEASDLVNEMRQLQNEKLADSTVIGLSFTVGKLKNIEKKIDIRPCLNETGYEKLLSSSYIKLDVLSFEEQRQYTNIACNDNGGLKPIFPVCKKAQELFAHHDIFADIRLQTLIGVLSAMNTAKLARWHHRRLCTKDIYIRYAHPNGKNKHEIETDIKVLNFRCPVTLGCFNGCVSCKNKLDDKIRMHGTQNIYDNHYKNDRISFSNMSMDDLTNYNNGNNYHQCIDRGEKIDVNSVVSFTIWLYTGTFITDVRQNMITDDILSYIPWPLRFIVTDLGKESTSISDVLIYLQAIQERRIQPHSLSRILTPLPDNTTTSDEEGNESAFKLILYNTVLQSAFVGACTEEPQAAMHLGKLLHGRSKGEGYSHGVYLAYFYYSMAVSFGENDALIYMAEMQAAWLEGNLSKPDVNKGIKISISQMLYLLLTAAVQGHHEALRILKRIPVEGINLKNSSSLFARDPGDTDIADESGLPDVADNGNDDSSGRDNERSEEKNELISTMTAVAKCYRRGLKGLPEDLEEARQWLMATIKKSEWVSADALLEYGLIERQEAKSREMVESGVKYVTRAHEMGSVQATFWLGWWHHVGLEWEDEVVVPNHNVEAEKMFRQAAERGDADSMAMMSRFHVMGFGGLAKDWNLANEWNTRARKKYSVIAFCRHALNLEHEARTLYRKRVQSFVEDDDDDYGDSVDDNGSDVVLGIEPKQRMRSLLSAFSLRNSRRTSNFSSDTWRGTIQMKRERRKVDELLRESLQVLEKASAVHADLEEVMNMDPLPYLLMGRLMMKNLQIWAHCDRSVVEGKQLVEVFVRKKKKLAKRHWKKAAEMFKDERWKRHRVNWRFEDRRRMENAQHRFKEEFGQFELCEPVS